MAKGTGGRALRGLFAAAAGLVALAAAAPVRAIQIDDRGEMRLGLRAYSDVRIGTERVGDDDNPLSYPVSGVGHLRQHRTFMELRWEHDLRRLGEEGWGLARMFGWMHLDDFKYNLQYRGEFEGLYKYGPKEYSDEAAGLRRVRLETPVLDFGPPLVARPVKTSNKIPERYIDTRISRLDRIAQVRNRLFQAYVDLGKGPVFMRIGRQVLAWGETDVFRLLDNINPLDASFGGFFIPLDERRTPLDMVRGSYHLGSIGPFHDSFLEGFGAFGDTVSTWPGIPAGSTWNPGGLNYPNPTIATGIAIPRRGAIRGGGRWVFNLGDVTSSLAYYQTYLDTPGVTLNVPQGLPGFNNQIIAKQRFPRVGILGGSVTFPVPSYYLIVRSEAAWFQGEPGNRQGRGDSGDSDYGVGSPQYRRLAAQNNTEGGMNPFVFPGFFAFRGNALNSHCSQDPTSGLPQCRNTPINARLLKRDSFNWSVGFDHNRFIRWLNPDQTFFITTQLFYKHVFNSPGDLILPVPYYNQPVNPNLTIVGKNCGNGTISLATIGKLNTGRPCRLVPRFYHVNDNQFLQTLAIFTSYFGGRLQPAFAAFYDWQGTYVLQPAVTLVRDPFRIVFDYTSVSGPPTGQLGTQRDRDNIRLQFEYVF